VLICHRLILSRLLRSLLNQVLANLVGVADRFFDAKAFPATVAILEPWWGSANLTVLLNDRLRHHLDDCLWRLRCLSVDLSEVLDPGQVPLGPSRDPFGVPKQDRNPIDPKLRQVLALRAFVDLRRLECVGANAAFFAHPKPR
jgi:hypothetical protein